VPRFTNFFLLFEPVSEHHPFDRQATSSIERSRFMAVAESAHELLKKLVKEVVRTESGESSSSRSRESAVLFDGWIDGVRCILLRPGSDEPHRSLLSPRETEIARMVAKGFPNKTIADVLEISPWTVCTHLRRIFAKLDVRSRAAMVSEVLEKKWSGDHGAADDPEKAGSKSSGPRQVARVEKR